MKTLKSMERDRQLWVRLGATLFLTEEEYQKIMQGNKDILLKVLKNKNYEIGGDSYIPQTMDFDYQGEEVSFNIDEEDIVNNDIVQNKSDKRRNYLIDRSCEDDLNCCEQEASCFSTYYWKDKLSLDKNYELFKEFCKTISDNFNE